MGRLLASARYPTGKPSTLLGLPNLKWWIEPDGIVATSGNIDSWTDKSGNGNTISSTGTNRPTVASAALNGYDGAQFVAANSQRLYRANTQIIMGPFAFGMVLRLDALVANAIYLTNTDFTGGLEFFRNAPVYTIGTALVNMNSDVTSVAGAFHMITYRTTGLRNIFRYDRADRVLSTNGGQNPPPTGTGSTLAIGARHNNTQFATYTVMAAYICSGFLEDGWNDLVESYWKTKYPSLL